MEQISPHNNNQDIKISALEVKVENIGDKLDKLI